MIRKAARKRTQLLDLELCKDAYEAAQWRGWGSES